MANRRGSVNNGAFDCPECGTGDNRVIDSRTTNNGRRRRHVCTSGHRFTTVELIYGRQTLPEWMALVSKLMRGDPA